ncbi:unnamed protein product [Paramecium octaurelia]|uniref:Transmembrane protein n=1 Tax=Paramecium octaurelia TaxID=43137 RepID=A0A8S1T596_PAROT|nr:unnamed protein product [Paramecium octaurelia]
MSKFVRYIAEVDFFGVPINLLTKGKEDKFQSILGGLIAVIIGSTSFMYFLYVIVLWTGNQIPSTTISKQLTLGYAEFELPTASIQLTLQDFSSDIDPFRKENNIITPLVFIIENTTILQDPVPVYSSEDSKYKIEAQNGTLILNDGSEQNESFKNNTQFFLVLARCSSNFHNDGSYCADESIIDNYLQKFHGLFILTVKLNQLDQLTRNLEVFEKSYYTAMDSKKPLYSQIMLKHQETVIDDGVLFNNNKHYVFLNNFELTNQEIDNSFPSKLVNSISKVQYNFTSVGCYLFRIDNIQIQEKVSLPKLGQVLAEIGSIVQLLFLIRYGVFYYNNYLLENELHHDIITMYYPQFKDSKLNILNLFKNNEKQINNFQSIDNLDEKYQNLLKKAKEKCRLDNILYEISRIQFFLQQQFGDQALYQSHQLGGKLITHQLDLVSIKETNRLSVKPAESMEVEQEPMELLLKQY